MEKYLLKGFYKYANAPNGKGNLEGELLVKGFFCEGEIHDFASSVPIQHIKGFLKNEEVLGGLIKLAFLKFPHSANLANLIYLLEKKNSGSFEGKYFGNWGALPVKISFNKNYGLFVAQFDWKVCGIGGEAEINLVKK